MLSSSFPTLVYHFHGVAAVLGLTLVFGPPVQAAPSSCGCRKLWGGRGTPMPVPKAPTAPSCCCWESEEDLEKGIPCVLCPSNSGTERCLISPARSLWLSPIPGGLAGTLRSAEPPRLGRSAPPTAGPHGTVGSPRHPGAVATRVPSTQAQALRQHQLLCWVRAGAAPLGASWGCPGQTSPSSLPLAGAP